MLHQINLTPSRLPAKEQTRTLQRTRFNYNALQSHQFCWLLSSLVSSILEAEGDGGEPTPGCRPVARTPVRESDTRPTAAPCRGRQTGLPCSPVQRVITVRSQVSMKEMGEGEGEEEDYGLNLLEAFTLRRSA